ncbi:MAG: hypothetical protein RLZZ528_2417 [Pseudomonadota bacterium]
MVSGRLDHWQYRIGPDATADSRPIAGMQLSVGPGLPVHRVLAADGGEAGLLLGFPIDLAARRFVDGFWQAGQPAIRPDDLAMQALRGLGGRFLLILDGPDGAEVYPDVSAQVPCVFDPAAGTAGSSAGALMAPDDYDRRLNRRMYDRLGVDGEGWFPAGLTAHEGLHRLLPGHALNLRTMTARRFWPLQALPALADPMAAVAEMTGLIRAQMEAVIAGPRRMALALTAGHETRLLLSCARPFAGQFDLLTVVGEDRHATDTLMARRIAGATGLSHIELPRRAASEAERDAYIRRGGHCNADSNARFHPSMRPVAASHAFVGGAGGEVGRAFFWRGSDSDSLAVTPALLTARFGLPATPEVTAALEDWLAGLPPMPALQLLDLAYLEHRDGAWYAVQFMSDPTLLRLAPLLTLRGVELMMGLPPDWKRDSRLGLEIMRANWPELLAFPFNSLGPVRDALTKLRRLADDPGLLVKKLRKLSR